MIASAICDVSTDHVESAAKTCIFEKLQRYCKTCGISNLLISYLCGFVDMELYCSMHYNIGYYNNNIILNSIVLG